MSSSPQKQNGTSLRSERGSSSTGHGNTLTNVCQRGERGPTFGISLGLKLMWELLCTLLHKLIKIQLRRLFFIISQTKLMQYISGSRTWEHIRITWRAWYIPHITRCYPRSSRFTRSGLGVLEFAFLTSFQGLPMLPSVHHSLETTVIECSGQMQRFYLNTVHRCLNLSQYF